MPKAVWTGSLTFGLVTIPGTALSRDRAEGRSVPSDGRAGPASNRLLFTEIGYPRSHRRQHPEVPREIDGRLAGVDEPAEQAEQLLDVGDVQRGVGVLVTRERLGPTDDPA